MGLDSYEVVYSWVCMVNVRYVKGLNHTFCRNSATLSSCIYIIRDSVDISPSSAKLTADTPLRSFFSLRHHRRLKTKRGKYVEDEKGKGIALEGAIDNHIDLSKLFLGYKFAVGAHSQLYHGIYKEEAVAVKITRVPEYKRNGNLATQLEKQFHNEVALLSRLHHPNVIKIVASCAMEDPPSPRANRVQEPTTEEQCEGTRPRQVVEDDHHSPVYCVIKEYLSEGSLRAYLSKFEFQTLPLEKVVFIALEIARGMEYVHSQGVIHRDIKPENILIDENFHMKVADFGIACEEASCDPFADGRGTYRWMAPEMIRSKPYGRKVDVYGFGLLLWEMVSGCLPFADMTPIQAAYAVVNKNMRPSFPEECPSAMRALIEQCWSSHSEKRPEFWQVVKVLENFESSLTHDGNLNMVQMSMCNDHKKGFVHWIHKLGPPGHSCS